MAASGLDSIALAVAHLERVENAALCCVAQDTATSEGDHLSSTTTLLPSLFQNHTRVVSTDHLEAKQPSSVSSSPRTTQSPPTCYCDPTPSSSVPLTEHKPWNYVSTSFMSPHSLASLHATTITGFGRPPNFYVPMAVSHPKTPEVERRCSSASPPSSSSSSPTQPKKSGTKKKNKPSSVVLSSSTSAAIPRNQPYKNLMLFFEMAPYPIPKDIQATSGDMIVSTADIQENDVLLGRYVLL